LLISFLHPLLLYVCILSSYFTPTVFSIMTPSKDHVFVSVIFTSTIVPTADLGPLKLTSLFLSVYPARTSGSFLLSPSTSTFTTLSLYACIASADCLLTKSFKRYKRCFFTSSGTSSFLRAAGVPSRGE